jgi:hypothetical protein
VVESGRYVGDDGHELSEVGSTQGLGEPPDRPRDHHGGVLRPVVAAPRRTRLPRGVDDDRGAHDVDLPDAGQVENHQRRRLCHRSGQAAARGARRLHGEVSVERDDDGVGVLLPTYVHAPPLPRPAAACVSTPRSE